MDRKHSHGELLLVLAGPMGAGKTTLLTNARLDKAALFGPDADAVFQATALPRVEKEFRLPLAEVLSRKTWASDPHLRELAELSSPPDNLVVHLDLNDFCRFAVRPFAEVLITDENLRHMQENPNARIFERYRRVYVATLETPHAQCAAWYGERAQRWGKALRENDKLLYGVSEQGEAALASIRAAWLGFVGGLTNVVMHWRINYDGRTVDVRAA